jgi:hypothetical protein
MAASSMAMTTYAWCVAMHEIDSAVFYVSQDIHDEPREGIIISVPLDELDLWRETDWPQPYTYNNGEWCTYFLHLNTGDRITVSADGAQPSDWPDHYWDMSLNFSMVPTRPCAECDTPITYDYLCAACREPTDSVD